MNMHYMPHETVVFYMSCMLSITVGRGVSNSWFLYLLINCNQLTAEM